MPRGLGLGLGLTIGRAVAPFTTEMLAYRARIEANSGTITDADLLAVQTFAAVLAEFGWTDANSYVLPLAGDQIAAAAVPVFRDGAPDAATLVNLVSGDYARDTGLTGNGTSKYLNTGLPPSNFSAADRSLHCYIRTRGAGSFACYCGANQASSANTWALINSGATNSQYRCNATAGGPTGTGDNTLGLLSGNSASATSAQLYDDGTQIATAATTAATPGANVLYSLAINNNGTAANFSSASIGAILAGPKLTAPQLATLATAMQTLMTAFGRQV